MHIPFQLSVFIFFENVPQNRVAGLCGSLIFRFLGGASILFYTVAAPVHILTMRILFSPHPCQIDVPRRTPTCLLPFWETLKSASKGSFQTASSVLVLGACGFCVHPFRVGSVFSCNPAAVLWSIPAGLQSQIFCELILSTQLPQAGELDVELGPSALLGKLCNCDSSPVFCGSPAPPA